ncbi:DNA repair protein RadC [Bacillus sp. EAC]|uniref:RadC family protein n=1 Tax=Bacillus sp. EAC TaxID=1978338 RepID=UPI000B4487CA|nr:DNA repair protein RadC [Bacillus sp. EAC]
MKDFPKEDRPRERLIKDGPHSLSTQELLAIVLRTGTKNEPVLQICNQLLLKFDGLRFLMNASIEELSNIKGIGEVKAVQLLAAFELGKRINRLQFDDRYRIKGPEDCANFMMDEMRFLEQEHFICLYLNTKNQIIARETIFKGSLNASIVHPREVFKEALRRSSSSIICLHNHPSGDPTPSREDIEVTKRLVECGKIIGIEILDHIIIGEHKYVSLKEKGYV